MGRHSGSRHEKFQSAPERGLRGIDAAADAMVAKGVSIRPGARAPGNLSFYNH